MSTLALLLGIFVIGAALGSLVMRGSRTLPMAQMRMLGLSFGLGAGIVHWFSLLTSAGGTSVSLRWVWWLAPLSTALLIWLWRRGDLGSISLTPPRLSRIQVVLLTVVMLLVLAVFVQGFFQPLQGWDARAIYGTTAKILFREGGVMVESISDENRIHYHRNYALLIPHLEASLFEAQGAISERGVKSIFPIFYASLLLLVYSSIRLHLSRGFSLLLILLIAAPPQLAFCKDGGAVSGYADIPLAYFWGGSVALAIVYLVERDLRLMLLSGMFLGFGALTKNEGLALCLLLPPWVGLAMWFETEGRRSGSWWKAPLVAWCAALVIVGPWLVIKARLPVFLDEDYGARLVEMGIGQALMGFPAVWAAMGTHAMQWNYWGATWFVLLAAPLVAWGAADRRLTLFLLGIAASQFLLYTLVYSVTPHDIVWHVEVSWNRLLIHLLPVLGLCCAIQLAGLTSLKPQTRAASTI